MTAVFANDLDADAPEYGIPDDLLIGGELPNYNAHQPGAMSAVPETWHLPRIVWDPIRDETQGEGTVGAVCDTGVDMDHPLLPRPIFAESFTGEPVEDRNSHGTHCSGTVLGRDFNIGVAPKADLIAIKVLSNSGSGSSAGIAKGIRLACDKGADVISLSLGGGSAYQPTLDAINYAFSKGSICVIAAGNSGFSGRGNTIGWPARSGLGICVAATQRNGNIAGFSSGGDQIDIAAPGQNILSTVPGGRLGDMSGTSMATPNVAGYLLLIIDLMRRMGRARWTAAQAVKSFIKLNTLDRGQPGWDPYFGNGLLQMSDLARKLSNKGIKWGV